MIKFVAFSPINLCNHAEDHRPKKRRKEPQRQSQRKAKAKDLNQKFAKDGNHHGISYSKEQGTHHDGERGESQMNVPEREGDSGQNKIKGDKHRINRHPINERALHLVLNLRPFSKTAEL